MSIRLGSRFNIKGEKHEKFEVLVKSEITLEIIAESEEQALELVGKTDLSDLMSESYVAEVEKIKEK